MRPKSAVFFRESICGRTRYCDGKREPLVRGDSVIIFECRRREKEIIVRETGLTAFTRTYAYNVRTVHVYTHYANRRINRRYANLISCARHHDLRAQKYTRTKLSGTRNNIIVIIRVYGSRRSVVVVLRGRRRGCVCVYRTTKRTRDEGIH